MNSYDYLTKIVEHKDKKSAMDIIYYPDITRLISSIDEQFLKIEGLEFRMGATVQTKLLAEKLIMLQNLKNSEITNDTLIKAADLLEEIESKCKFIDGLFYLHLL